MMPLVLAAVSFKKEIRVILTSLGVLLALPIIALTSITDVAALKDSAVTLYTGNAYVGDTYDYGFCTYWAAMRRAQTGHPIPNNWGNANTWAVNASLRGYQIDHNPQVGAIMQTTAGPLGHVAFVESVDPSNGSWTISEMNFKGWDETDNRTLPAKAANEYNFIH